MRTSRIGGESPLGLERRRAALLRRLPDPAEVMRGSVTERTMRCGKASCRCQGDPGARHGPYRHLVTTVGPGKTRTILLTPEEAERASRAVAAWRRTLQILKEISETNIALLKARRRGGGGLR